MTCFTSYLWSTACNGLPSGILDVNLEVVGACTALKGFDPEGHQGHHCVHIVECFKLDLVICPYLLLFQTFCQKGTTWTALTYVIELIESFPTASVPTLSVLSFKRYSIFFCQKIFMFGAPYLRSEKEYTFGSKTLC